MLFNGKSIIAHTRFVFISAMTKSVVAHVIDMAEITENVKDIVVSLWKLPEK